MYARVFAVCLGLVLLAAPRIDAQCNNDYILVGTLDFGTLASAASLLNPVTKTATINVETLFGAPSLRTYVGRVFVVSDDDKIRVLDPCNNFDAIYPPLSTGSPSLARDIVAVSPTLAYVTRYDRSSMWRFNPSTGGFVPEFNLGVLADADGLPEMNRMFAYGGRLYVCLERTVHATGNPTGTSMLAVIDIATDTLVDMDAVTAGVQGIPLLLQRPISEVNFRVQGGVHKAYFSCIGLSGVIDGGVVQCDASNPAVQSVILLESTVGGDIGDVEIVSDTKGFALMVTLLGQFELIAFNPSTGLKIGSSMLVVPPGVRYLTDIEPSSLGLLLADFNTAGVAGIRCFDMTTHTEIPGGPISMGYAPYDILVRQGPVTDAGEVPAMTALGQNYPNPFNPETSIPFTLARGGRVVLRIFDVTGAHVATLVDENREAGRHTARWNGRTDAGSVAPTGVYFARLETAHRTETKKLALLK